MVQIQFRPGISNGDGQTTCYRVAEQSLVTDFPLPDMVSFRESCPDDGAQLSPLNVYHVPVDGKQIYRGPGWIGNQWREVICQSIPSGYQIRIEGIGTFLIAEEGKSIVCSRKEAEAGVQLLIEAAIGPALILALAVNGTLCFHASAVLFKDHVIVFLGESGKGKSTLASWLDGKGERGWRRLADDILPAALGVDGLQVLPHYPQLKIAAEEQPSLGMPGSLPASAIYVVRRSREGEEVAVQPLGAQESALVLARHTVASRLFDADLMIRHLDFCIQAGSQVPVRELIYPLIPSALQEVQEALLRDLQPQIGSVGGLAQGQSQRESF